MQAYVIALAIVSVSGAGQVLAGSNQAADVESWRLDQRLAMQWARDGKYDDALPVLDRVHKEHPNDLDVTRNYLAALDWSGHDDHVLALFNTLPDDHEPDYVLLAAGHAYLLAGQTDKALAIYSKGDRLYPENSRFAAGQIRVLLDTGRLLEAAKAADTAILKASESQELDTVVEEARHVYAVSEAREGRYIEALQILGMLHERYPTDVRVIRDYLVVMAWSGNDKDAVALYQTSLQHNEQPDYVYAAVGRAYRNLKQPADAVALYHEALQYYPDNKDFQIAQMNSLREAGHGDEAALLAGADMQEKTQSQQAVQLSPEQIENKHALAEQGKATALAREGHYAQALAILRSLMKENPENMLIKADYITVLSWAGRDAEAVRAYEAYGQNALPDFTLAAIGHSYRNRKRFAKALSVYRRGQAQSPTYEDFTVGVVDVLLDMKHYAEAQKAAEDDLRAHGDRSTILILASRAAAENNKLVDSLIYAQRAVAIDPENLKAVRARIYAEQKIGAVNAADETMRRGYAGLSARDIGEIEDNRDAALVRWAALEPVSESARYKKSDEILQILDQKIASWSQQGKAQLPALIRARLDRIVALRDRYRMQEALDDYVSLRDHGVTIPAYVLAAAGDAYLYLRQPEAARDVYLEALKTEPNDFDVRRQLFFAYVECDDFDNAYATIDKLRDDEPIWYYLKDEPERQPNANRALAEIGSASARMYAGELAAASDQLQPLAAAAPYDVHIKEALGSLDLTRGWPRQALEEFRLGTRIQNGIDVGTETGAAVALLDMRDYRDADSQIQALSARYPENLDVQRAARQFAVYDMAELHVDSFYNMRSSNSPAGGEGYGVDTSLYSAPIDYNWRLFAGTRYAHEDEPNNEGAIGYVQSRAGGEYRDMNLQAMIAPTYNVYHSSQRAGFDASGDWTFNDLWRAGGEYQSFSNDTPLRAMNAGVTASRYASDIEWRQSESREARFDVDVMPFSDGNTRLNGAATYSERLYTTPYWDVDAIVDGSSSHDTADENRDYYNPKLDFTGLAGARVTQILYRRYETLYEHSFQFQPGAYWQQDHGMAPAWTAIYRQNIHLNDTLEAGASVNDTHQAYDGVQEDNVSFLINLVERF